MKTYKLSGIVYGKLWGGGYGAYPAEKLNSNDRETIIKEAKKLLRSGGLDSGMGFEYLKGAYLNIEEIEKIEKGGKEYKRSDFEGLFIGDLTEKEQDFLTEKEQDFLTECKY